jgi:hypothetical protein
MDGGHTHRHDQVPEVPIGDTPRLVLLVALGLVGVLTVWGLVGFWPKSDPRIAQGASLGVAPGVTFPYADVLKVHPACPRGSQDAPDYQPPGSTVGPSGQGCGQLTAKVRSGQLAGKVVTVTVPPDVSRSGIVRGDSVQLTQMPVQGQSAAFSLFSVDRSTPIGWLAGFFVLTVAIVARVRGILALVGLGFGALVLVKFMLRLCSPDSQG